MALEDWEAGGGMMEQAEEIVRRVIYDEIKRLKDVDTKYKDVVEMFCDLWEMLSEVDPYETEHIYKRMYKEYGSKIEDTLNEVF